MSFPLTFGEWLKSRRKALDLTQNALAERANCSVFAVRKIETGERRPSKQLAEILVTSLEIPLDHQNTFKKVARGEWSINRLSSITAVHASKTWTEPVPSPSTSNLPCDTDPMIGRKTELSSLAKLLSEPNCRLLTITGLGGIGKTRLAIDLAKHMQNSFPGGVYYVSLSWFNSPEFIVPAIAKVFGFSFSGTAGLEEQLFNHLVARSSQAMLLVLDNLEHLLLHPAGQTGDDVTALLLSRLLTTFPNLKILATSLEWSYLREEWIFELHGLPVPTDNQSDRVEECSSVALFLRQARQVKADFKVQPDEWTCLARICQLVEGSPLAIELAAAWVSVLSLKEIMEEITSNLDILATTMRNIPERQRSLRAVFAHSWNLLSDEEKSVLCRLAVFRGGFQRQAAEKIAGASLSILLSLLSKSLVERKEDGRYDLHALIRRCALERLRSTGDFEETCHQHLSFFVSLALEAYDGLRSAQLAEWLHLIEQEHNNIRAALEWAFSEGAPSERVDQGFCLINSIGRYWEARGHIQEGITWLERGLQVSQTSSQERARALRMIGLLYNHGEDEQTPVRLLQESLALARQLNDEVCQANALDTLADVAWRFGNFQNAKACYAESLEILRKIGDPRSIGLSLASAGRLHVDYGYYPEAEQLACEGLLLLDRVSDLRGRAYCLNVLGRVALLQGDVKLAASRFRQSLLMNVEMHYLVDTFEILHEISVVKALSGDQYRATLLLAASTMLNKSIGIVNLTDNRVDQIAPPTWLQDAPCSQVWSQGLMLSMDQAVAYALEEETG